MTRITDYLVDDHRRLHALLDKAGADPFDSDSYTAFRARLLRHIAIEEKILLPAAKRRLGRPIERAARLRVEHAALTSLMVPSPDRALCSEIRGLLTRHDAQEEGPDGVYAECEAALGDESAALCARARDQRQVPVSRYYDGPEAHRTADSALASAKRIAAARKKR